MMILKLTVFIRDVISFFYKPRTYSEIPIFGTFLEKFTTWPIKFYWKSAILRFGHVYDVIVTSYADGCSYLLFVCMERGDPWLYYGTD